MASSGQTLFNPDGIDVVEEAYERCGLEGRGGYSQRTARRSINLMFADWANRGVNLFTIEERTEPLLQNTAAYTLGANNDVVDVIEQVVQLVGSDPEVRYAMNRVSISTQATRTNPNITGRPTEVWYDRTVSNPVAHIWPLPPANGLYVFYYTVLRRMDDMGAYTNTLDMPFRFFPAFVSGLAFMLAEKNPGQCPPDMIARLEKRYSDDWIRAAEEDRDKSVLRVQPRGDSYRVM